MFEQLKGKKLYRRPADAILFGVAAGLGEYLQIDVVFVRLVLVLVGVLVHGWPMLIAYVVAIFLMPINPAQETVASNQEPKDVTPPGSEKMDSNQNM